MTELLQHWVTIQAKTRPDDVALVMGSDRVTYGRLDADSTRLAHAFRDMGFNKGDRICLLMPKSPLAIVSILGILKADCTYVPIEPSSPSARIAKMLVSCEPSCILVTESTTDLMRELLSKETEVDPISWTE